MQNSQDLSNALGKIHRVNADGSVPNDNPFLATPGAPADDLELRPSQSTRPWRGIPSPAGCGNRSMAPAAATSQHRRARAQLRMGCRIEGAGERHHEAVQAGMEEPLTYYTPSLGPSAIAFYTGNRFPGWKNTSLFVAGMVGHPTAQASGRQQHDRRRRSDLRSVGPRARHRSGPGWVSVSCTAESRPARARVCFCRRQLLGRVIRLVPGSN